MYPTARRIVGAQAGECQNYVRMFILILFNPLKNMETNRINYR